MNITPVPPAAASTESDLDMRKEHEKKKPTVKEVFTNVLGKVIGDDPIREKVTHTVYGIAYALGASQTYEHMLVSDKLRTQIAADTAMTDAKKAYGKN